MIDGKRVMVVLPAYNAGRTLEKTISEIPMRIVDELLLVDDASGDDTVAVAERLGIPCVIHPENRGYGGNQKTCYSEALKRGADIVTMLHPDYQYPPRLIEAMVPLASSGQFDVILGSRILGEGALAGGMPRYKYVANRLLTFAQNVLVGSKLSEFHTGYRAFSRRVLETLPLAANSDDFLFDNQMLVQAHAFGMRIGEISCPTRYFEDASEIDFARSVVYGFGVVGVSVQYALWRAGLVHPRIFSAAERWRLRSQADGAAPAAAG